MIPAFPLDGDRLFRSLLEWRYDLERSTRIAGTTGRWLAFALIVVGMATNLWLAIIGVFIYLGASAEETARLAHLRLVGHRVGDVMLVMSTTVDVTVDAPALRQHVRRNPRAPSRSFARVATWASSTWRRSNGRRTRCARVTSRTALR